MVALTDKTVRSFLPSFLPFALSTVPSSSSWLLLFPTRNYVEVVMMMRFHLTKIVLMVPIVFGKGLSAVRYVDVRSL